MQEQLFVATVVSDTSTTDNTNSDSGRGPTKTARRKTTQHPMTTAPAKPEWELDEATKAIGRRGLASAREALRKALAEHETTEGDEELAAAA